MDLPDVDPSIVRNDLLTHEVVVESYSGDVLETEISAIKKTNLEKLLDNILLQVEILDLNVEHNKLAERRVRLGLLLAELGQKAEVEVTEAEMTQAIMEQARQYPGQERQFFEFIQKNEQMQQQIRAPLFEDKVVDYVFEQASVTEKEVTKNVLQKSVESLEEE